MTHSFNCRVYYEDTDLAGIVYYANYLKFIERARTEFVRERGIDQTTLKQRDGIVFAVRRIEADYLSAARFDDELTITTAITGHTAARLHLQQTIHCYTRAIFDATVTLVALTDTGKPTRLPATIRHALDIA